MSFTHTQTRYGSQIAMSSGSRTPAAAGASSMPQMAPPSQAHIPSAIPSCSESCTSSVIASASLPQSTTTIIYGVPSASSSSSQSATANPTLESAGGEPISLLVILIACASSAGFFILLLCLVCLIASAVQKKSSSRKQGSATVLEAQPATPVTSTDVGCNTPGTVEGKGDAQTTVFCRSLPDDNEIGHIDQGELTDVGIVNSDDVLRRADRITASTALRVAAVDLPGRDVLHARSRQHTGSPIVFGQIMRPGLGSVIAPSSNGLRRSSFSRVIPSTQL